jgi:hypothetical protein
MARGSAARDAELDALIRELLSHADGHGVTRQEEEVAAAMTDALAGALRRVFTRATPLERALFVEALAPALAEALAPALAEALAPALAEALGDAIAPTKASGPGKGAQETGTGEAAQRPETKPKKE